MNAKIKDIYIDKRQFFTYNSPEFQGEKVFFRGLSKFSFFCRLNFQTAFNE